MKTELENSTALYERYRERARVSLGKASGEHEDTLKKLSDMTAQQNDSIKLSKVSDQFFIFI